MKITLLKEITYYAKYLHINAELRHPGDDFPEDMPHWDGKIWSVSIDLDEGRILDWEAPHEIRMHSKVCDAGSYELLDEAANEIHSVEDDYVLFPASFLRITSGTTSF